MPEQSPNPSPSLTPAQLRFDAQRKLGLFAPLDYTALGLILFSWLTLGFWAFFGHPAILQLVACALLTVVLMLIWLLVLIYRVLVFILDTHADISLMPEAAARVVIGYHQGGLAKQPVRDTRP